MTTCVLVVCVLALLGFYGGCIVACGGSEMRVYDEMTNEWRKRHGLKEDESCDR